MPSQDNDDEGAHRLSLLTVAGVETEQINRTSSESERAQANSDSLSHLRALLRETTSSNDTTTLSVNETTTTATPNVDDETQLATVITSPNYPEPYPGMISANWR